jgi:hypothetical protein
MTTKKEAAIKELKTKLGIIDTTCRPMGRRTSGSFGEKWEHDAYSCTIRTKAGGMRIDYKKGIGHNGKKPNLLEVMEALAADYIEKEERDDKDEWLSNFSCGNLDTMPHKEYVEYEKIFKACVQESEQIDGLQLPEDWREIVNELV